MSAAFSPIMIDGALVLLDVSVGMIDASATRRLAIPWTRSWASTTAIGSAHERADRGARHRQHALPEQRVAQRLVGQAEAAPPIVEGDAFFADQPAGARNVMVAQVLADAWQLCQGAIKPSNACPQQMPLPRSAAVVECDPPCQSKQNGHLAHPGL